MESPELVSAKQQVKLLEAQLAVFKDHQSSLLATVYWALGGVFVLVGLLSGFTWLANFKIYERDRDAIRSELDVKLSGAINDLTKLMTDRADAAETAAVDSIAVLIKEAMQPHENAISSIKEQLFTIEYRRRKKLMEDNTSDSIALTEALGLLESCRLKAPENIPDIVHFMLKKIASGGQFTANEITRVNHCIDQLPPQYKALTDRLRAQLVASDIFG